MPESILDIMPVNKRPSSLERYLYSLNRERTESMSTKELFEYSLRKSCRYLKDEYYFVVPL